MGVPKFYRWLSERYPCLSQVVKDYQIPEFDNLYLDMNGIIHPCSHPNDDDPTFRIPESKIFADIFAYLEMLFRIIKPQKVLFLAVDGVAPRAKMNQQRGRRFRSAREAQDLVRKALQKGEVLPSEPRFDSNCITPGTQFMARLHAQLKLFVHQKLASDPSWQQVQVILSGHDVPGEGEHKVMDYIRHVKAQPGFDPNTRHCLYGLDADLIMLGLATHEPHFSLLREEVRFGRQAQKRQTNHNQDTMTFHLLHLSILREYIEHEFAALKSALPFSFDLERIIDDWILIGFLVGNDFIPHLPNLHIKQDALPFLFTKYIEVLPMLDGYINEAGRLNMTRFEAYLSEVAEFDRQHFDDLISDLRYMEGKKAEDVGGGGGGEDEFFVAGLGGGGGPEGLDGSAAVDKLKRDLGIASLQSYFADEDCDRARSFDRELAALKVRYYVDKFGFSSVDGCVLGELSRCYVVGVQWVLAYYYTGVPSWSWFYPYHYAPFVSDIAGVADLSIEFDLGRPFLPFEQLLAVLPPASRALLPKPLQVLMMSADSAVRDYYPVSFETDLNGKQHDWEAVVLIPLIDETRLVAAMQPCLDQLSEEERERNGFGSCLVLRFDPEVPETTYPSPTPQSFPDVRHCRIRLTELPADPFPTPTEQLCWGLCPGVRLDVHYPGFPSLKHVAHEARLQPRGVRVFQAASRGDNLCLKLIPGEDRAKDVRQLARQLVGSICCVGWPFLVEARITALSDGRSRLSQSESGAGGVEECVLSERAVKGWAEAAALCRRGYSERLGIDTGPVDVLVYAQVLQGLRYVPPARAGARAGARATMAVQKQWSNFEETHPLQTVVSGLPSCGPDSLQDSVSLEQLFPPNSSCFLLAPPHYGSLVEVVAVDTDKLRVVVKVKVEPEVDLSVVTGDRHLSLRYLPSFVVARQLGMPALVLARITSSILVERGSRLNRKEREKLKIGLALKFAKRNRELLGYARKTAEGWSYSPAALELLRDFLQRCPALFSYLRDHPQDDSYYEADLFPEAEGPGSLVAAREWLLQLPTRGLEPVDCGSQSLDQPQISAIEKAVLGMKKTPKQAKTVKLKVKPSALHKPMANRGGLIPDSGTVYELFDRVVSVALHTAVPFALRGTVIGIHGGMQEKGALVEVLFDKAFLGGLTLRCSPNKAYRLPPTCLINVSHSQRVKAAPTPCLPKSQHTTTYSSAVATTSHAGPTPLPSYSSHSNQPPTSHLKSSTSHDPRNSHSRRKQKRQESDSVLGSSLDVPPGSGRAGPSLVRGPASGTPPSRQPAESRQDVSKTSSMMDGEGDFSAAMGALSKLKLTSPSHADPADPAVEGAPATVLGGDCLPSATPPAPPSVPSPATVQPPVQLPPPDLHSISPNTRPALLPYPGSYFPPHVPLYPARFSPIYQWPSIPPPPPPHLYTLDGYAARRPPAFIHFPMQSAAPMPLVRKTDSGLYVGVAEVGSMKFQGAPCPSKEEASRSAAAAANVNYMYPPPRPPLLRYPQSAGLPVRPLLPPPLQQPYGRQVPQSWHPRGPRPPRVPESFVPLQVQRRYTQGWSDGTAADFGLRQAAGELSVENVKGNLLTGSADSTAHSRESSKAGKSKSGEGLQSAHVSPDSERLTQCLTQRLETAHTNAAETQARLDILTQVLEDTSTAAASSSNETDIATPNTSFSVDNEDGAENLTEPMQASDAATGPEGTVQVVGEILSGNAALNGSQSMVTKEVVENTDVPGKRPQRQLAASFHSQAL